MITDEQIEGYLTYGFGSGVNAGMAKELLHEIKSLRSRESTAQKETGYVIITRYVRPDRKIVHHVYGGPDGSYPTRSKANTAKKSMIREDKERMGDKSVQDALDKGFLEITVTKLIPL
jgi:hypothetical protein